MTKHTGPSDQIKAGFRPDRRFFIDGRGTSVIGKQGDHVTAYAFVEAGFHRILADLTEAEVEELFELGNREALRKRRSRIYDYISSIAFLATKEEAEQLLGNINFLLEKYNKERHSKKGLLEEAKLAKRVETKLTQEDESVEYTSLIISALRGIEVRYKLNGALLCDMMTEIVRETMTFYNHLPRTSYIQIPGFEAARDEGSAVVSAKREIERLITMERTLRPIEVANALSMLFHYPEITGVNIVDEGKKIVHYPEIVNIVDKGKVIGVKSAAEVLTEHVRRHREKGVRSTALSRDNGWENLRDAMGRHLHIAFAVYPELTVKFDRKELIRRFVEKVIKGKEGLMGWPSFNNPTQIGYAAHHVENWLDEVQRRRDVVHYTKYDTYSRLASSDDEEGPPTKPQPRPARPMAQAGATQVSLSEAERAELQALRKFKEIVEAKGIITPAVTEELRRECPDLYKSHGGADRLR